MRNGTRYRSVTPAVRLVAAIFVLNVSVFQAYSPAAFLQQETAQQEAGQKGSPLESSPLESSPLGNEANENADDADDPVLAPWEEKPWTEEKINNDLPQLRDISPRDLLVDVDDGEIEHLFDHAPIEADDATLIKVLFRLRRFRLPDQQLFVSQTIDLELQQLIQSPEENRLKMFAISGRVKRVERIELVQRVAELYQVVNKLGEPRDFTHYFQVHVELQSASQKGPIHATVCCIDVPQQWLSANQLDEPFSASAMFLKINSRRDSPTDLLLATNRIEWFPESNRLDPSLNAGALALASHGFDVSLLDDARTRDRKSINAVDTDCFYRLLNAIGSMDNGKLIERPSLDLIGILKHPGSRHGELYQVRADIRRVTRIEVDHPFYRDQFAMTHYYQLDGFVDSDVAINDPQMAQRGLPGYGRRYPISICVTQLPRGMRENSNSTYAVSLPAFFFKNWTFRSQLSRETDINLKHVAPLMIGLPPMIESRQSYSNTFTIATLTTMSVFMFGFIWFGFWRLSRQRRLSDQTRFQLGEPSIGPADGEPGSSETTQQPASAELLQEYSDFPGIDP